MRAMESVLVFAVLLLLAGAVGVILVYYFVFYAAAGGHPSLLPDWKPGDSVYLFAPIGVGAVFGIAMGLWARSHARKKRDAGRPPQRRT